MKRADADVFVDSIDAQFAEANLTDKDRRVILSRCYRKVNGRIQAAKPVA